jgi:hypothetical protein
MQRLLRAFARRLLAVERPSTYYLPWLTRPGLECALIVTNVESRFKADGPCSVRVVQYDADGTTVRGYDFTLRDSTEAVEIPLQPTTAGCGFVTVSGVHSDLYVTLSNGETYTATHGRGEFVERYPALARAAVAFLGGVLALAGRTIPAFARDQYVYADDETRSHVLLLNLSNVVNRIRVSVRAEGETLGAALIALPPMGARLVDVAALAPAGGVRRVRLTGNAWFNLYLVGVGPRDLAGPLSLMHVK